MGKIVNLFFTRTAYSQKAMDWFSQWGLLIHRHGHCDVCSRLLQVREELHGQLLHLEPYHFITQLGHDPPRYCSIGKLGIDIISSMFLVSFLIFVPIVSVVVYKHEHLDLQASCIINLNKCPCISRPRSPTLHRFVSGTAA